MGKGLGSEEEPCLLLCLLPGGGALDEGWLGATWREFRTTSEIFPTLMYSRLFVYPRPGGKQEAEETQLMVMYPKYK